LRCDIGSHLNQVDERDEDVEIQKYDRVELSSKYSDDIASMRKA
jgi:hypothetical protein